MERFTGMGFIRLCSSVHNVTSSKHRKTNKNDPSSVPSLQVLGSSGVFPLLVICSSFDVTVGQIL